MEALKKKNEELDKQKSAKQKLEAAAAERAKKTAMLLPSVIDKAFFEKLDSESATSILFDLATVSGKVEKLLNEAGVRASKLHRPNNLHKIFSESKVLLPNLDFFYKKLLHIPCGWWVTDEDREKILDILERG